MVVEATFKEVSSTVVTLKNVSSETRVTRLAGKIKILLLFWILHECFGQLTTRAFKTSYCLNPHRA